MSVWPLLLLLIPFGILCWLAWWELRHGDDYPHSRSQQCPVCDRWREQGRQR